MREQLTAQGKSFKGMSVKLTEMMVEAAPYRDLQVMVLVNIQEEPQVEGRIELRQEIDQFGSSIHDLQGLLNENIEASEAHFQSVMDTSQCMKQEEESQPLNDSLLVDVDVEEVDKSEDVKHNVILELRNIDPHSKHFSTLCLGGNLEIESSKPMEKCIDEKQHLYILKFIIPKTYYDIPHLRAKKYKRQHLLLGPFMLTPLPREHNRKLEKKLWVKFISSK
ncbi:hypothetical protein HAX54_037676 [Datura stramonium]|uniref:Uncharacterized protein n=1 Tax=Datura stramonium TaxID=4076 RepID=A0ABS8SH92_DATST|nr:hypothetical protein [Datura stramonium]